MDRPVIGITAYVEPASWRVWRDVPAALVPHAYVRHVFDAGGLPVILPPLPAGEAGQLIPQLNGLIVSGGADVEPPRYGAEPHPLVQDSRPDRDEWELALMAATAVADLPVLGVCRGMQVMAVAAGGALEQHLPDRLGTALHCGPPGTYGEHEVATLPGSRLRSILGDKAVVATYHHQGVLSHPGYEPVGWATGDGLLEAFEDPDARFRLGVQWHPEVGPDGRLFQALVEAAIG